MKVCATRKCRSWFCLQVTQLQFPVGCHGHHAILCNPNRFIFGDNKNFWYLVVPSVSNYPRVQGKSNLSPRPRCVCVGGGGA